MVRLVAKWPWPIEWRNASFMDRVAIIYSVAGRHGIELLPQAAKVSLVTDLL